MMKAKSGQVIIFMEPMCKEAFYKLAQKKGLSVSALGRKVMLSYLLSQGVITIDMMAGVEA